MEEKYAGYGEVDEANVSIEYDEIPTKELDRLCWMVLHGAADFEYRFLIDDFSYGETYPSPRDVECRKAETVGHMHSETLYLENLYFSLNLDVEERARRYVEDSEMGSMWPVWIIDEGYSPNLRERGNYSLTTVSKEDLEKLL